MPRFFFVLTHVAMYIVHTFRLGILRVYETATVVIHVTSVRILVDRLERTLGTTVRPAHTGVFARQMVLVRVGLDSSVGAVRTLVWPRLHTYIYTS